MTSKGQPLSFAERLEIGERWEAGQSDAEIAAALGHSIWVVRKWRRKYQHEGRAGLITHWGRPAVGALGSFPEEVRRAIREMKETHPGWGPLTILTELKRDERFAGQRLPSRSRIAAYLKEQGLTRSYERHSDLPQPEEQAPQHPHEEWEMDAQGAVQVSGLGRVAIINVGGVYSRMKIAGLPCLTTSHLNAQDDQLILRRAFATIGLPERITLDHDSVFYDNTGPSPFPSWIHLWLLALGITVRFIAGKALAGQSVEIRFDAQSQEFACVAEDGRSFRLKAQGLSREALMELSPLLALPVYQLALPFSRSAWREAWLWEMLTGTAL